MFANEAVDALAGPLSWLGLMFAAYLVALVFSQQFRHTNMRALRDWLTDRLEPDADAVRRMIDDHQRSERYGR